MAVPKVSADMAVRSVSKSASATTFSSERGELLGRPASTGRRKDGSYAKLENKSKAIHEFHLTVAAGRADWPCRFRK